MGFEDVGDLEALRASLLDVDIAIAPRIDHDRFPAGTDDIGKVRQAGRLNLFEYHESLHAALTQRIIATAGSGKTDSPNPCRSSAASQSVWGDAQAGAAGVR
jgi:hypothetical protein